MKIDIIIPVHDQLKYTKACIESLYEFTDESDFRLIVIDSGSTDGTMEWFCYHPKENLCVLAFEENIGWCKAINEGYKHLSCDSDFVLWANNDIVFQRGWLEKMIAHFKPGVGAVGPTSSYVAGRQKVEYNEPGQYEEEVPFLTGFCLMIRKEVVKLVGDVDERFGIGGSDDLDYCLRMRKEYGYKCILARDVYIHHFGSKTIMPYVGNRKESYVDFIKEKESKLIEKWGEDVVNDWLYSDPKVETVLSGWPRGIKLGWALPLTWPYINSVTHLSLMAMERPDFVYLESPRGGDIANKREAQIERGMDLGCTHFFILDADMEYHPRILRELFNLLDQGADLASGLCWRGYPPWEPVVWHTSEQRTLLPFKDFRFGDVVEAAACGAGCLLVKREVFDKLPRPWFDAGVREIKQEDGSVIREAYGEDNYFTRNATKAGFKLLINTELDVGHLRYFSVDRNFWLMMALMSRVIGKKKEWSNVIALFKKMDDPEWFESEVNNSTIKMPDSIDQRSYEIGLLYNFLLGKKPKTILEIGTHNGGTAILWGELARQNNGMVYCLDKEFKKEMPYDFLPVAPYIVEIEGDSHDPLTLGKLKKYIDGGLVDFLFIDGDHTYQGVKMDHEDYSPLVRPGGWIAFHDIVDSGWQRSQNCGVVDYWNEIKNRYNHFEILDPNDKHWCGIGVLQKKEI